MSGGGVDLDLDRVTASELVAALAAGTVGSAELLDAQLARIERLNPVLNAVVALDADRARDRARLADDAAARGERWGPLHGLPMTVKDCFETEGLATTSGAPELASHVPERDASAVARLKAAGAIVVGKTNLPTYASDWQSFNPVYGLTRNPWDPDRTVGGSSGGSAAAVASGMTTLELGSDIAGSIRVPSHYCGVFGHKPTWSAVPLRGHIPGPPGALADVDLGVAGPIGRSVADLSLALGVLVGDDPGGVPGARLPAASPGARSLSGCRVGLWADGDVVPVSADVRAALTSLADALTDAGAIVDERARPAASAAEILEVYGTLLFSVVMPGELLHRDWLRANERRVRIAAEFAELFTRVDVVVAPVSSVVAFPHDTERPFGERVIDVDGTGVPYPSAHMLWAGLATLPLLPSTAVPVRRTASGLPVGVQVIGPQWADLTTLAFASLVEEAVGGFVPPPLGGV